MKKAPKPTTVIEAPAALLARVLVGTVCVLGVISAAHTAQPNYLAPLYDALSIDPVPSQPIRLLGIDLEQDGEVMTEPRPIVNSEADIAIVLHWIAQAPIDKRMPARVEIVDAQAVSRETAEIDVGPKRGETWSVGHVYTQRVPLEIVNSAARAVPGQAYLTVSLAPRPRNGSLATLMGMEILLQPMDLGFQIPETAVETHLPKRHQFLRVRTRLGIGSTYEIEVPEALSKGIRQIAIVSYMSHGFLDQGVPVANIHVQGNRKTLVSHKLTAGVTTAHSYCDFYPEDIAPHKKVDIFTSEPASQLDQNGLPFESHSYITFFDVPSGADPVDGINFECIALTTLDIVGVAIIYEQDGP